jgi:hypothetical protein
LQRDDECFKKVAVAPREEQEAVAHQVEKAEVVVVDKVAAAVLAVVGVAVGVVTVGAVTEVAATAGTPSLSLSPSPNQQPGRTIFTWPMRRGRTAWSQWLPMALNFMSTINRRVCSMLVKFGQASCLREM